MLHMFRMTQQEFLRAKYNIYNIYLQITDYTAIKRSISVPSNYHFSKKSQKLSHIHQCFHPKNDLHSPSTQKNYKPPRKFLVEVLLNHEKKQTHHTKRNLETDIRIALIFFHHVFFQQNAHFKPPVLLEGYPPKVDSSPLNSYLPNRKFHLPTIHFQVLTVTLWGCSFPMDAPLKETTRCFKHMMETMLGSFFSRND